MGIVKPLKRIGSKALHITTCHVMAASTEPECAREPYYRQCKMTIFTSLPSLIIEAITLQPQTFDDLSLQKLMRRCHIHFQIVRKQFGQ